MHKLLASIYKEYRLLSRDIGGLAILFIMPLVLVITITLIQDSSFKTVNNTKVPILIVDNDQAEVSQMIYEGLTKAGSLEVLKVETEIEAKSLVFKGDYQLAIVIPEALSSGLNSRVTQNVSSVLAEFGIDDSVDSTTIDIPSKQVRLYFDPATQTSFKTAVKNGINRVVSQIETYYIYEAFKKELGTQEDKKLFDDTPFVTFAEIAPQKNGMAIIPNSAQHNVPAWALFAIFFIIVPLSINMVKEKNQGTFVRLRAHPVSYATVLGGKTVVYLGVCLIQFALMLLIGVFLFPVIGLPSLDVSGKLPLLFIVTIFAGLAAIGLGLLLGTIARSQEQAAPFGATLVVILAAIGGVWVPVFVMPKFMQMLSNISPMNWGLNGFYDVFLRAASFKEILPEIGLLFVFFIMTTGVATLYYEKKNEV